MGAWIKGSAYMRKREGMQVVKSLRDLRSGSRRQETVFIWAVRLEEKEEEEEEGSVRFDESGGRLRREEEDARGMTRRKQMRWFTGDIVAR